jgi:hypothetical protein
MNLPFRKGAIILVFLRSLSPVFVLACLVGIASPALAQQDVSCADLIAVGSVLQWTSYSNGSEHAQGALHITKVDGDYFEAIQTSASNDSRVQMYGATYRSFISVLNPSHDEAWMGECTTEGVSGIVGQYSFTFTR